MTLARWPSPRVRSPLVSSLALAVVPALAAIAGCTHLKYGFAKNPLPESPEVLARGATLYGTHCASCHGPRAAGDGPAAASLPAPPTNLVVAQREWSDGVFHIRTIARAKNGMPSFRDTLTEEERWAVIRHVRSLDAPKP